MNKKKYISVAMFFIVVVIFAGIAYYFDPAPINNALGIDSAEIDTLSGADISLIDSASSSLPLPDPVTSADSVQTAPSSAERFPQKKDSSVGSDSVAPSTDTTQARGANSSPAQNINSSTPDVADVAITIVAPSSSPTAVSPCSFPNITPSTTKEIILNEIAWMGSVSSSNAEWMELKNISSGTVDLSGWKLLNASGKIAISFSDGDAIAPGGFFLLTRGNANISGLDIKTYTGDLANTGDTLALMDPQCGVSDYLDASRGWPAGNNTTKATMERDTAAGGWHTSALPGGTPGVENSADPAPAQYALQIAFDGNAGGATITSDPAGLACAASCIGSFASGTQVALTPDAGANAVFSDWSGLCYGQTVCSFVITATTSLTAEFRSTLSATQDSDSAPPANTDADISSISTGIIASSSDSGGVPPATTPAVSASAGQSAGHILIAAVQIAGATSDNDLVKLYNPTGAVVDMSGWKLHKRSQTGTDYSLKAFPTGSVIAAGQYFVWANSENGFSETVGADVSSTEILSADNSVALLDAAGNVIDAVAWGTGTGQYGEGPPYPTSPGANQMLSRRSSGGVMADTDNNTNDFTIQ